MRIPAKTRRPIRPETGSRFVRGTPNLACWPLRPLRKESAFPRVTIRWRPLWPERREACAAERPSGGSWRMALKALMTSLLAAGPDSTFAEGEATLPLRGQL